MSLKVMDTGYDVAAVMTTTAVRVTASQMDAVARPRGTAGTLECECGGAPGFWLGPGTGWFGKGGEVPYGLLIKLPLCFAMDDET
jgi:hypothetical protein